MNPEPEPEREATPDQLERIAALLTHADTDSLRRLMLAIDAELERRYPGFKMPQYWLN